MTECFFSPNLWLLSIITMLSLILQNIISFLNYLNLILLRKKKYLKTITSFVNYKNYVTKITLENIELGESYKNMEKKMISLNSDYVKIKKILICKETEIFNLNIEIESLRQAQYDTATIGEFEEYKF